MTGHARSGDRLVRVACCNAGPVLVRVSARADWQCGKCRSSGVDIETLVLGEPGEAHAIVEEVSAA